MSHPDALTAYIANCRASGFSAATLAQYRRTVSQYLAFCENKKQNPDLPAAVAAYKAYLADERAVRLSTVQYHLTVLRRYYDFCAHTLRSAAENPVLPELDVSKRKLSAERKPYGDKLMTEQEIKALVSADRPACVHEKQFLRNRAAVLVLVMTGVRNAELLALTPADLSFGADGFIIVRSGKGDKFRHVPFPMPAQQAVCAYLACGFRPADLPDNAPLFGAGDKKEVWHALDRFTLSTDVARYVEHATGHKGERTHALRHAFASTLLTNGAKIQEIQANLGHSSIRTTERYAALLSPQRATATANTIFNELV